MAEPASLQSIQTWDDDLFLAAAAAELEPVVGTATTHVVMERARSLLRREIHTAGLRALIFQIIRNRDPEMKANHVTELNLAHAFAGVEGREIELERSASERNDKRIDFGLDDSDRTFLVEVKNLNAPVIKRADDPNTRRLADALKGRWRGSDLHLTYLFFRRPREQDVPALQRELAQAWDRMAEMVAAPRMEFIPRDRPRVAALFTPARKDTGGRVIVYDHGDHLVAHPGRRIRAAMRSRRGAPAPRELVEELFVKDNILRRLQDSEGKFPLHDHHGRVSRIVVFHLGDWAPYARLERYLRQVAQWYCHGTPAPDDFWGAYYPFWAERWRFECQRNVDAVVALRGSGVEKPYAAATIFSRSGDVVRRLFLPPGT